MLSKRLHFKKFHKGILLVLALNLGAATQGWAQLSSFQAQYFQDQYLVNPAMAGIEGGVKINAGYQMLNTNTAGSPHASYGSAEYSFSDKASIGFLINSDQAGLLARTRVMGTYAYHLHLNETDRLSFGLSVGVNNGLFVTDQIVGDQGDQSAALYNSRPTYVDGDFGMTYSGKQVTAQVSIPNLRSLFLTNSDLSLAPYRSDLYISMSYKIPVQSNDNSSTVEPKLAYRGFKGADGIIDLGANLSMLKDHINFAAIYHTNQSVSISAGLGVKQVGFIFSYTNDMGPFRTYASNTFELGLKFNLLAPRYSSKGHRAY